MPQKSRPHRVTVKLTDDEYELLDASAASAGVSRSQLVRDALRKASAEEGTPAAGGLSRVEALELLAAAARAGSVAAAASLARELRLESVERGEPPLAVGAVRVRDLPPGALQLVK